MKVLILCLGFVLFSASRIFGQSPANELPKLAEQNGRHELLVDGKPFFILGGQVHNSSAWPAMLPKVWEAAGQLHLNTLEAPLYWEQVEPEPGRFDFSLADTLLAQARQHHVHLILLWFATWKNGSNHYMPGWMKQDPEKYPNITGKNGQPVDSPSPYSKAALEQDSRAFAALMHHLKAADPQHTVIMVQVENETGSWGSVRDYSPTAQKLFEGTVPAALLKPEVLKALNRPVTAKGTWSEVFGDRADEYFQAWSVASYAGKVAAAGRAEYPLPLYVNAALRDPLTNPPATNYESGGPTDNVIPVWKAAAPAIDLLAPDIYLQGSERILKVLDLYDRPDNALMVPEIGLDTEKGKYLYAVIAHGGIGFSPFGIDDNGSGETPAETEARLAPFSADYAMIGPMASKVAQWAFEGRIKAVVERDDHAEQVIDLGAWQAVVDFGTGERMALQKNPATDGRLIIVQLGENEFIAMGARCHVMFRPAAKNKGKAWQYLKVEEGSYVNGEFKLLRILNGDETDWGGPHLGIKPEVLRVSLVTR
ncbi:MAG TPA: DUF5597 domain-containing protein [Mucilaginibacter sp.]|nr:DUF5597 domain-containing protein [Mucilaginibacter sp.]